VDLSLVVDHACNLRCRYCYTGEKLRRAMTAEVGYRSIDLALERRPAHLDLAFFGGEPLLQPALLETLSRYALERAGATSLRIVLCTNGTLVDDRTIAWIRTLPSVAALVSLDGPADLHDRYRVDADGRGSHARARAGLQRLAQAGVTVTSVAVVNPDTAPRLGEIVRELLDLGGDRVVLAPNYAAPWSEATLDACARGLTDAADEWMGHLRRGGRQLLEPLAVKILSHLYGVTSCPGRCQLGGKDLAVAPSGNLYPCPQVVGEDRDGRYVIGDVTRGIDPEALVRIRAERDRVTEHCAGCDVRLRCDGLCGCKHVMATGEMGRVSGEFCDIENFLIDAADRVGETLYAEGCAAFRALFYEQRWVPAPGAELLGPERLARLPERG
jgi:uncharacterized protein